MSIFFKLLYGPKLYWVYLNQDPANRNPVEHVENAQQLGQAYQPEGPEKWGHTMVSGVKFLAELGVYVGPLLLPYIYRRMDDLRRNPKSLADFALVVSCIYMAGLMLRAVGRVNSPVYREFFETLSKAKKGFDTEAKEKLAKYDFDFAHWPVEFNATRPRDPSNLLLPPPPKESSLQKLTMLPHRILGWAMMNVFGLKLLYPGSTRWFLQALIGPAITEHRAVLVNKHKGQRIKLGTADDNEIDSMFFDRRGVWDNGDYLVICCEGNAGFYEVGMLLTPLERGYSVIGWNHPGFWGSTGSPLPSQEVHAVDAVMQYAQKELGFREEQIIVYGWSIGGFPASWLAMHYPRIKALILDATFDHIAPLAIPRMPAFLSSVVTAAVEDNVNLDVSGQLAKFDGPVRLIRRVKDEMISTDDSDVTGSNRGNDLLLSMLKKRYPKLVEQKEAVEQLNEYMRSDKNGQEAILRSLNIDEDEMLTYFASYGERHGLEFPCDIGEDIPAAKQANLLLYLASKLRTEFDSGHNTPLRPELFELPWDLSEQIKKREQQQEQSEGKLPNSGFSSGVSASAPTTKPLS